MRFHRSGILPPDLKALSVTPRHEDLKEALQTIAALLVMVAVFLLVMIAAVPPEPRETPTGWEEVRR